MPNRNAPTPERKAQIAALQAEIEAQERSGQFHTVHHEMLRNLLAAESEHERQPTEKKIKDKEKA